MASEGKTPKYVEGYTTSWSYSVDGKTKDELGGFIEECEKDVRGKIKVFVDACKKDENKWKDPDFGPTDEDELGACAMYGNPPKAPGAAYPKPESIRWDRPIYASGDVDGEVAAPEQEGGGDDDFDDDDGGGGGDVWCTEGRLFCGGTGSGDIIQGALGDCWFLSALSVMATRQELLENLFFDFDKNTSVGIFCLKFFKDNAWHYIMIDDRIPCNDNSAGEPCFAKCRDKNELWVLMIEKAFAKIHGCYKALIGGYVHYGVADMTGFAPLQMVIKEGHQGFHEPWDKELLWQRLWMWKSWGSLLGCSIQPLPGVKVAHESDAAQGLMMMHAYSFLDMNTIETKEGPVKLCKIRNPWGHGEWTGKWSDDCEEREKYHDEIDKVFSAGNEAEKAEINKMDGTFFMSYDDWFEHFSHIFVAIDFPSNWIGNRASATWDPQLGGNRNTKTWPSNPKFKLTLTEKCNVFVGLNIEDTRLTHGQLYYNTPLQGVPMSFDVIQETQVEIESKDRAMIPKSLDPDGSETQQPPYFYQSMQTYTCLEAGEYILIPSLYKRGKSGTFFLETFADKPYTLEGGILLPSEKEVLDLPGLPKGITRMQFNIHIEDVRDKMLKEAKKLQLHPKTMYDAFTGGEKIDRKMFKQKLMGMGFNLTDFPDEDFLAIDVDNSGVINVEEFKDFFETAIANAGSPCGPNGIPEDDLGASGGTDMDGRLSVKCIEAKGLKPVASWFDKFKDGDSQMRKKTLIYRPMPVPWKETGSNDEDDEDGAPSAGVVQRRRSSMMAGAAAAKMLAAKAKENVADAGVVADKLHYSEPLKELEGRRNAFLKRVKNQPRKCSSDTQPTCWDRLPKGGKIDESYFLNGSENRRPLVPRKKRQAAKTKKASAEQREAAKKWIIEELAPSILTEMLENVFSIREFRISLEGKKERTLPDPKVLEIKGEIDRGTPVYSRYQEVNLLDLDNMSSVDVKPDALSLASAWFKYIDKNKTNNISKKEFGECMGEIGVKMGKDDLDLLMRRFRFATGGGEEKVNYSEFMTWAEGAASGKMTKEEMAGAQKTIQEGISNVLQVEDVGSLTTLKTDPSSLQVVQAILRDAGCRMDVEDVYRMARVFNEDLLGFHAYLMGYQKAPPPLGMDTSKLRDAIQSVLQKRCEDGVQKNGQPNINVLKVWQQMSSGPSEDVLFETVRDEFVRIMGEESIGGEDAETFCRENYSMSLMVSVGMVLDSLLLFSRRLTTSSHFSFADIDGFVREQEIGALESKFYLALQVHASLVDGKVPCLVDTWVDRTKQKIMVRATDIMTMKSYFMLTYEDMGTLWLPQPGKVYDQYSAREEGAFWRFSQRLTLLSKAGKTTLSSSEQEKFVDTLRTLVAEASLPFFVTVNNLTMSFEVDSNGCKRAGGIRKLIYSAIKPNKKLHAFLCNTFSTLTCTFSTYDGDEELVTDWSEFMAHLNGMRNPYATMELLPLKVHPVQGGYGPPVEGGSTFFAGQPDGEGGACPKFRRCAVDFDFKPPVLALRPIMFTDVCKLSVPTGGVEPEVKLFVIMVRKGADESYIVTAYDPKSASDYQCVGAPREWKVEGACKSISVEKAGEQLEKYVEDGKIQLGECITPRVMCRVYNKLAGKGDEFLGTCEISISGVLSNCGQVQEEWAPLTREGLPVGQVLLSMQFKTQVDIDMDLQAAEAKRARMKKLRDEAKLNDTLKKELGKLAASGSTTPAGGKAAAGNELEKVLAVKIDEIEALKKELDEAKASKGKAEETAGSTAEEKKKTEEDLKALMERAEKAEKRAAELVEASAKGSNTGLIDQVQSERDEAVKKLEEAEKAKAELEKAKAEAEAKVAVGGGGVAGGVPPEELEKVKGEMDAAKAEAESVKAEAEAVKKELSATQAKLIETQNAPPPPPPKFSSAQEAVGAVADVLKVRNTGNPTRGLKKMLSAFVEDGMVDASDVHDIFKDLGLLDLPGFVEGQEEKNFGMLKEGLSFEGDEVNFQGMLTMLGSAGGGGGGTTPKRKPPAPPGATGGRGSRRRSTVGPAPVGPPGSGLGTVTGGEAPLPEGWEMRTRDDGKVYYVDHGSRKTQWSRPV